MKKIVLCTGGFDPVHSGHISYLRSAKALGDILVVGLNSDDWLRSKKGSEFMTFSSRKLVLENLRFVDTVIDFDDIDNTACNAIEQVLNMYPDSVVVFANGGDRTLDSTPELDQYKSHPRVSFSFGTGGTEKIESSSSLLFRHKNSETRRKWGNFAVLDATPDCKVKKLEIAPGMSTSLQQHAMREEIFVVVAGTVSVLCSDKTSTYTTRDTVYIPLNAIHMIKNTGSTPAVLVEVQLGTCLETDIVRFFRLNSRIGTE
jgi:D-beta-D-heptose 7-phosphate kinase/D-beta-D-heptose 1-phosphate adenosyltransferase